MPEGILCKPDHDFDLIHEDLLHDLNKTSKAFGETGSPGILISRNQVLPLRSKTLNIHLQK